MTSWPVDMKAERARAARAHRAGRARALTACDDPERVFELFHYLSNLPARSVLLHEEPDGFDRSRRHDRRRARQQPQRGQAQTRNHNVRQKSE